MDKDEKIFYRIAKNTIESVWYDKNGNKLNNPLVDYPMDYDENHIGYVSVVASLKEIVLYFKIKNLIKLFISGYRIYKIKTNKYKFYNGYYLVDADFYYRGVNNG